MRYKTTFFLRSVILLTALCCFTGMAANAQHALVLRNGSLQPIASVAIWADSIKERADAFPLATIAQFSKLPSAETKQQLERSGVHITGYISSTAFSCIVLNSAAITKLNNATITSIYNAPTAWKIDPVFAKTITASAIDAAVTIYPEYAAAFTQKVMAIGGTITDQRFAKAGLYAINISGSKLQEVAAFYAVANIGKAAHIVPLNFESKGATKAVVANFPIASGGYGLTGTSMTIGIGDNTSGLDHIDNRDRIINFNPAAVTAHGLHITGIAGGAGIVNPYGQGFAYGATLLNHLYDNVIAETPEMRVDYGMTITNNSYGADNYTNATYGQYDGNSQALDYYAITNSDVLQVFAAGNDGFANRPPYPNQYANTFGGYQAAKNGLVVANNDKNFNWGGEVAGPSFGASSRGPVRDGRMKPEISAVGTDVTSTYINDTTYLVAGGTSMSSPQVAGGAALISQQYKALHSGTVPQADVLKTILMNGAMDIGNTGPDYTFGFGCMDIYRSLAILNNNRYSTNTIATGASQTSNITVPAGTAQLKVMLYWQDALGNPTVLHQLVNDLDLTVTEPSNTLHLPLSLDTTAANVANVATEHVDHINNAEQVTINSPAAGSYTVAVNGYNVPSGTQRYVLAYDFIPTGVQIMYPLQDAMVASGDNLRVYWDASPNANTFTLEFSSNNGSSWTTISSTIPAAQRYYVVPSSTFTGVNSEQCLMRLTRNTTGQQHTTDAFVVNTKPVLTQAATQCPGYINLQWTGVTNNTGYIILQKKGAYLQPIDTTVINATSYSISGLSPDSTYYVAVQPLVNGKPGFRTLATRRQPNNGTCTGSFSNGDLILHRIVSPVTGRIGTSTALTASSTLTVEVYNADDITATDYDVSYRINGGTWVSQHFNAGGDAITAASMKSVSLTGLNLATAGTYTLDVAVTNNSIADPTPRNDSLSKTVRQLANAALSLATAYKEDFESSSAITVPHDSIGFTPAERWDFHSMNDTGRLRTFVSDVVTIGGSRSISMDMKQEGDTLTNTLMGTFNLAAYSPSSTDIRLSFDYKLHGLPRALDSNKVWIRANDIAAWIPVYTYDTLVFQGTVISPAAISLSDVLNTAGQTFSTSTQIKFTQKDTSVIASGIYGGNGITIDNIGLQAAVNDIALLRVTAPVATGCAINTTPVSIKVFNTTHVSQSGITASYQLDGGTVVTESLPTILARDSITFTFATTMTVPYGEHLLNTWIHSAGDNFPANDSVLQYDIHNEPLVASFPYLENFEGGDGYWFSGGSNSSWQYGTPTAPLVHKAASGTKAWKTNLSGTYNNNELSYLYSPCFDISGLTHAMLSFSVALDVENCGTTLCDAAWVEYSTNNGTTWTKLGAAGQGFDWYTNGTWNIWNNEGDTRWHVASIPLPASAQPVRLRFVLNSDPGTTKEGISVDDIHVYDKTYSIYSPAVSTGIITQSITGGSSYVPFLKGGQLVAEINPETHSLGSTTARAYHHSNIAMPSTAQYFLPRSFVLHPTTQPSDSVTARFYVTEKEVDSLLAANSCPTCQKPVDVYSLGITKYDDPTPANEDSTLNNNGGTYNFYSKDRVTWVPYDSGYYAQLRVASFSEFWLNPGGISGSPLAIPVLVFNANKISETSVLLTWHTDIDAEVSSYEVQRAPDGISFATIATVASAHVADNPYTYTDVPPVTQGGAVYYRIVYHNVDGTTYISDTKRVDWTGSNQLTAIFPNPSHDGQFSVEWSGAANTTLQLSVTDVAGRKLYTATYAASGWNNVTSLQIPGAVRGVYFVRCDIGGNVFTKRVVIN